MKVKKSEWNSLNSQIVQLTEQVGLLQHLITLQTERLQGLAPAMQEHFNQPWTRAHPRNGVVAEVEQYLGGELVKTPPPLDTRATVKAEEVMQ